MSENQEVHFQDYAFDSKLNRHSAEKELLKFFPEEDIQDLRGFLSGFQIKNVRTGYEREVPEWATKNEGIQKILLTAFPKLHTDAAQRKRAGRWAQVINLYFKKRWSRAEVAEAMGENDLVIKMLVRSIVRVADGKRADGSGMRLL
jgi:hypothetical protein